ncbi:MAG: iron chaperone [Flavobacterium sp.]
MDNKANSVEEYIAAFPTATQAVLNQVRAVIKQAAPDAAESISYAMPAFKLNGKPLLYFAGYDKHVGLYATPTGHEAFAEEFSRYKTGKGSVQFPLSEPMPLELIERVAKFRVAEVSAK